MQMYNDNHLTQGLKSNYKVYGDITRLRIILI